MIKVEPAWVLASSVSARLRRLLPEPVLAEIEVSVSGTADLLVLCAMPALGSTEPESLKRLVRLEGHTYPAIVYGRRVGQTTKFGIPLHGILLNGIAVLDANVLTEIEPGEAAAPDSIIDLSAAAGPLAASGPPVLARMSGRIYRFASREHFRHSEALLEAAESDISPRPSQAATALLEHMRFPQAEVKTSRQPRMVLPGGRTETKVLVLRADFSDLPGDPWSVFGAGSSYSASSVQAIVDTQIAPYYAKSSYGRASLSFTVAPQLYRLSATAAHYATSGSEFQLYDDVITAAQGDYPPGSFDKTIVVFSWLGNIPGSQLRFAGLSLIGASMMWINGEFDFRVVAHELGHTLGLYHANFWHANDDEPITDNGYSVEYGDPFDTMSSNWANDQRVDFNPWFKYQLNWIHNEQVQTVTENGLYRVYRFDDPAATGTLALRVAKDADRDYWIGFRRNFTENAGLQQGAYVVWGYHNARQSNLQGLGPVINNPQDPGLPLGTGLVDADANVTLVPVAEGGDPPNEYLDVQITFGPPQPVLRMSWVAGQMLLSWPVSATNFVLETRADLTERGSWAPVNGQLGVVGATCVFTNQFVNPAAFFRLHRK